MTMHEFSRRDLFGGTAAALCCRSEDAPQAAVSFSDRTLTLNLSRIPALRKRNTAIKVVDLQRKVNLIVVHGPQGQYAAMDRSCTHGGAQVAYNHHHGTVQCTSWGHSEFALDGEVLGGSAKRPLRTYAVRRNGSTLEVDLA